MAKKDPFKTSLSCTFEENKDYDGDWNCRYNNKINRFDSVALENIIEKDGVQKPRLNQDGSFSAEINGLCTVYWWRSSGGTYNTLECGGRKRMDVIELKQFWDEINAQVELSTTQKNILWQDTIAGLDRKSMLLTDVGKDALEWRFIGD